ncbi:hypothetical protein GCM10009665_29030 [Kitasatospora nipponensis]|uniref:Uncharacterized protein n=1 Tax=Kitasatospora nipponensis TaxID=258049 RepID=A0ABN1W650_9ACTN
MHPVLERFGVQADAHGMGEEPRLAERHGLGEFVPDAVGRAADGDLAAVPVDQKVDRDAGLRVGPGPRAGGVVVRG